MSIEKTERGSMSKKGCLGEGKGTHMATRVSFCHSTHSSFRDGAAAACSPVQLVASTVSPAKTFYTRLNLVNSGGLV